MILSAKMSANLRSRTVDFGYALARAQSKALGTTAFKWQKQAENNFTLKTVLKQTTLQATDNRWKSES